MAHEKVTDGVGSAKYPKKRAGLFSLLTFWWMNEVFQIGAQRPLEEPDFPPLEQDDKTHRLTEKIQKLWESEKIVCSGKGRTPRLWRCILMAVCPQQFVQISFTGFLESTCRFVHPMMLGLFIWELVSSQNNRRPSMYIYTAALLITAIIKVLAMHQFCYHALVTGMRVRAALKGVIYLMILRLSQQTLSDFTTGQIISLVSNDVQRFDQLVQNFFQIWQSLFELVFAGFLLCYFVGWPALVGLAFLILLVPMNVTLSDFSAKLRKKTAEATDRRVLLMNELLEAIRTVKINAWEWISRDKIRDIRGKEVGIVRQRSAILSVFAGSYFTTTAAAILISVMVITRIHQPLTLFKVIVLMTLMNELRHTISMKIVQGLTFLFEGIVSINRIQRFLLLPVLPQLRESDKERWKDDTSTTLCRKSDDKESQYACVISNLTLHLNEKNGPCILKSISLAALHGSFVHLAGPVGSGKSSLLRVIAHETSVTEGRIFCSGSAAYVPQMPWVFPGTIRENILFGEPFDEENFKTVVKVCALERDLASFPEADKTVVGERGAVLSGGQKARICLARAVYANADVYLLDDPLSAVDAKVGAHIFQKCICEFLSTKTRFLVSNAVDHMKKADRIVLLSKGAVLAEGNFMEMSSSGVLDTVLSTFCKKSPFQTQLESGQRETFQKHEEHEEQEHSNGANDAHVSNGLETSEENKSIGAISLKLYWKYFRAGISSVFMVGLVVLFVLTQILLVSLDAWLAYMVKESRKERQIDQYTVIYVGIFAAALVFSMITAFLFYHVSLRSSERLHDQMTVTILKAPVLFFDINPIGRILNRFAKDIGSMDEILPTFSLTAIQLILSLVSATILPCVLNPWILIAVVPTVSCSLYIVQYFLKSSRELKRLESIYRSPVFSHFSETLNGLDTIRTRKRENDFIEEFYRHQDRHNQPFVMGLAAVRWMGVRVDLTCTLCVGAVAFASIFTSQTGAWAGLSLVYILQTLNLAQNAVQQCTFLENEMTSVERVMTYTEIEPEPGYENQFESPEEWPQSGSVNFVNVSLRYYPGGPQVLKNLNINIDGKSKIGVAGRTGAGKSSIIASLLRMPEATGIIAIDGVNLNKMNLQDSRSCISVLGQTPLLFSGPLRTNLDPLEQHNDADLWRTLELVQLKPLVDQLEGQLNHELSEGGGHFSVGERQLLCLARVLLQRNKVVILDEPTAHVDPSTEQIMQTAVHDHLKDCTVITVAHRLNTIRECDKIFVMEGGRVVESGSYEELMVRKGGVLADMAKIKC